MSKICINRNILSASSIPAGVRKELLGKELTLYQPPKIFVIGQPTVGSEEAVERYDALCKNSRVVTRSDLLQCANDHGLSDTIGWIEKQGERPLFFFDQHCCTAQI